MNSGVTQLIEGYLRAARERVLSMHARGEGRQVLGAVAGRPVTEDQELAIDRACDEVLDEHCRASGLRVEVHSEHGVRRPFTGGAAEYLVTIDPFDGTGLYKRQLPAEWWSVLSVFTAGDMRPVAAGAVDILRGELYLADESGARHMVSGGSWQPVRPRPTNGLAEGPVIAAFLMDPTYLALWTKQGQGLVQALVRDHPQVRIWPNGGSCVYPWLARGLVQAYVMFDEPRSEIDPGVAFAALAGIGLYSVSPHGDLRPYRMDLTASDKREAFFIAACTESLAREIAQAVARPAGR
jgi:fructose-1,6-bisphosphatase/inositol monophosphatase family enzyme